MFYKIIIIIILCNEVLYSQNINLTSQKINNDSIYITPSELEDGYGIVWTNKRTQDIREPEQRIFDVAVSPNERFLAYNLEGFLHVLDMRLDSIVFYASIGYKPRWSPDSRYLYFDGQGRGYNLWDSKTGKQINIPPNPIRDTNLCILTPRWAPDGDLYFINCYNSDQGGSALWSLWRTLFDSSMKVGHLVNQPVHKEPDTNNGGTPIFPPHTTKYYLKYHNDDWGTFRIIHNFDYKNPKHVSYLCPDTNWEFSGVNIWGPGSQQTHLVPGPNGEVYRYFSFRAKSETLIENTPPFSAEHIQARDASGWYRLDTLGNPMIQLVRSWAPMSISITADGKRLYYSFLEKDSTCSIYSMNTFGKDKVRVVRTKKTSSVLDEIKLILRRIMRLE